MAYFGENDMTIPDFMWKGKGPRTLNSLGGKCSKLENTLEEFKTEL